MSDVDPYVQPIPPRFASDRELRSYFEYLHRWLHDMWVRTGGGNDQVQNQSIRELYPWTPSAEESSVDSSLFQRPVNPSAFGALEVVSVSADYTTKGNEIVVCTNTTPITITLNATPEDTEQVHVIRQNTGDVEVSGAINGDTSLTIGLRYSSPHLVYTINGGEWSIV